MRLKHVYEQGKYLLLSLALISMASVLFGCGSTGDTGPAGAPGAAGAAGGTGATGPAGPAGGAVLVAEKHGEAVVDAESTSIPAKVEITGATADAAGVATVTFTVKTAAGAPITGLGAAVASVSNSRASFQIASLAPKGNGLSYNYWVPYIYTTQGSPVSGHMSYRERPLSFTEGPAGTYTYTFAKNLATATYPDTGAAVGYDPTRTHRVIVALRSGYSGGNTFDFVPAGGPVIQTRNMFEDTTCQKCHHSTPGHYGGMVKACVVCHSPGNILVNSAANGGATNSMAAQEMLHKIHAGTELKSVAGPDGQYYDNPWTAVDETADNGPAYQLGSTKFTGAFPAVLANCQACHTGTAGAGLENVDNWKDVPSRTACGSCHDNINWATGANHAGGVANNDDNCTVCHPALVAGFGQSVTTAHNWTTKDIRNIPEFDITLTTNTPSRGYYINGERPVISIALKDRATGATIVPSSVIEDPTGEGCVPNTAGTACTVPRDGLFRAANVYVTGPRGERVQVLTYPARAKVTSSSTGPWDLTAVADRELRVQVDSIQPMLMYNTDSVYEGYGADEQIPGDFSVTLPAANLTVGDVVAALNADATFSKRARAYGDEALSGSTNAGRLSILTRGTLAKNKDGVVIKRSAQPNIRIVKAPANMFGTTYPTAWATAGSAAQARIRTTASNTDPNASFTDPTAIKYTLDLVDDMVPGTYVINVEFADAGRGPGNPPEPPYVDYRTPSVAVTAFQIKQAATEKLVADNCTSCHWSSAGRGFVLDYPRHNKLFNAQAVDQCGGCHQYKSGMDPLTTSTSPLDFGTKPLSRRVHAVHNGANLNYPTLTVGHEETSAFGRNWRINYPMEIRNCESCHPAATTSGSWKTNPSRLACMGCHDSDAATAHMKLNTYDPTPMAPWSGDEKESCKACH